MKKRYTPGPVRSYLAGATAARVGDEMSGPALLLAGLAATGSAQDAAALPAGLMVSAAAGGPLFGVLLDRSARPGRLLAGALALYAAALVAILAALGRLPLACLLLLAVLAGLLGPALSGGWTSQLPGVAPAAALPRANALDAMTYDAASLAGPALSGGAAQLLGAPAAVVLSAVLVCLALPPAWRLPGAPERGRRRVPVRGRLRAAAAGTVLRDLAAGARAVAAVRTLARATAASVVSSVGGGIFITCAPLLGEAVLGGAGRGALLLSCAAGSALAANAVLARHPPALRPDTVLWVSTLVRAAAFTLTALALFGPARPWTLAAVMLVDGTGQGPQLTALFAVRHRDAPARLLGQVFTTGASLKTTGYAVGTAAAGPLSAWSLPGTLLVAAGCHLTATLAFAAIRPGAGASERPSPPASADRGTAA